MRDHGMTLQIEFDVISMKRKSILTRSGLTFGTLTFDEKSFSSTALGFTPYGHYKPTNDIHADSLDVLTSEKN